MKQHSLGLGVTAKRTRRSGFLDEMEKVVPWADLVALVSPYLPEGKRGRPPLSPESMLRIHFMQQWFALNDPAMEDALHYMPVFRELAGLEGRDERLPDESTILRFRHVLEKHQLAAQLLQAVNDLLIAKGVMLKSSTVSHATLITAPSSTKNKSGEHDPAKKRSRKCQLWYFGMKCHICVDIETDLIHTVKGSSGAVNDVVKAYSLLREIDREVFADAGYQAAAKRPDAKKDVNWPIAMRPVKRRALDPSKPVDALIEHLGHLGARIRARAEHPFRVVKRQFGHVKVRYRGLAKDTAHLHAPLALPNL
ncbi:IS5 family transposase [Ideonella sp. 4Y11]|uniref:IS5 family transposase n=1 Tax=Ideonella aquatica TaxID=2824119 RepID=A0A940YKF3_9BURK|nr:IS5 family transposase [Ideonella aquatica]MBQ0961790.1 IS5 family transposase [Ideonella aquatica]